MNKVLKNILMFLMIGTVVVLSSYLMTSCSSIFSIYKLSESSLIKKVFATRDGNNFILFSESNEGEYYDGFAAQNIFYTSDNNFIYVVSEDNDTKFEFLAISDNELYCYSINRNFYYMELNQYEN